MDYTPNIDNLCSQKFHLNAHIVILFKDGALLQ